MAKQSMPLGFLPGDIEPGSHCMLVYNKQDETYIRSVVEYIGAGIRSGQMCICAVLEPMCSEIRRRMKNLGVDMTSGQLLIPDAVEVYLPDGRFDARRTFGYYAGNAGIAQGKWNGLRIFGDVSAAIQTRSLRLKTLEYEALANERITTGAIAMCGYESSRIPRGFLLQAKNVHPFIASSKSIRLNRNFSETRKFLAGLYRYRRVGKEYAAGSEQADRICADLEEIAVRTPMAIPDIEKVKEAVCSLLPAVPESDPPGSRRSHIHLVYVPRPDRLSISVRCHRIPDNESPPDWALPVIREVMDEVHVDKLGDDSIITMMRKY